MKHETVRATAFAMPLTKQPTLDFASPEQLGGIVAFLCSPAADQITGTTIAVDGGWTAQKLGTITCPGRQSISEQPKMLLPARGSRAFPSAPDSADDAAELSRLEARLPLLLSMIAGMVDTTGFFTWVTSSPPL